MNIILGIIFIGHGIAHLVGFVSPWRIMESEEMPYKTTLLNGRVNVGDVGIRVVGLLWLIAALAFIAAGVGVIILQPWWSTLALTTAIYSLILSVLGWPDSRIGVLIDILIIVFLVLGSNLDWLP
ncbi:MAG: ABC transporter permease [Anaerolineales bacterium]|nr:ABC transporter permease [Anaerolineales bacterium]